MGGWGEPESKNERKINEEAAGIKEKIKKRKEKG